MSLSGSSFATVAAVAVHVVTHAGLPADFRVMEFDLLSIDISLAAGARGNRSEPASPAPGTWAQG